MSGLAPNTVNIALVKGPVAIANQLVTHPEYQYWRLEWSKIRDCLAGQREIKRKARIYLPKMRGSDDDDYASYLHRAVFFNMTGQTQNGMIGQVFRRDPRIDGLPKKYDTQIKAKRDDQKFVDALNSGFTKDNASHLLFAKTVISEQIAMGRFGVLVDAPDEATVETPDSFAVGYTTENILDWSVAVVKGRYTLTRVLLREFVRKTNARYFSPYTYDALYRELLLVEDDTGTSDTGYKYVQNVFIDEAPNAPLTGPASSPNWSPGAMAGVDTRSPNPTPQAMKSREMEERITPMDSVVPMIRGKVLGYIPFVFFGSSGNQSDVEKPPLLDIADLNISHYQSYAQLEHGRFYTALPVYYAPGNLDQGAAEYNIGPNVVWEVPQDARPPGILEYTGQGLKALEAALAQKEQQIAAIGGRMMPGGSSKNGAESEEQTMLRNANEYSLLLNVIQAAEAGMTWVVRYWLAWRDVPLSQTTGLRYKINTDFLAPTVGARELRAIQMMYEAGVIPIDVLYDYLRKGDVINPEMSIEEFKALLDDPKSFINQPDVSAMQRGFANREQELEQERIEQMREDNTDAGLMPGGLPKPNKDGTPGTIPTPNQTKDFPPGKGKLPPEGKPAIPPTAVPENSMAITKTPKNPGQTPKSPVETH